MTEAEVLVLAGKGYFNRWRTNNIARPYGLSGGQADRDT